MPSVLTVKNLRVARGRAVILRGIDWCVRPGQHGVILRANGSGKTSRRKALTGYFSATFRAPLRASRIGRRRRLDWDRL